MALLLYQLSMVIYFYFSKTVYWQAFCTFLCAVATVVMEIYNFLVFRKLKTIQSYPAGDLEQFDGESLRDEYLHPCKLYENELSKRFTEQPIYVDLVDYTSTPPRSSSSDYLLLN